MSASFSPCRPLLLAGTLMLCSCATPKKQPQPTPAAPLAPSRNLIRAPKLHPVSLTPEPTPAPLPSRSEEITRLVRTGRLINAGKNSLLFSLPQPPQTPPGGIFEDAIVQTRLRGHLKKVTGLPEAVIDGATVQAAQASLQIGDTLPAELTANAIDSALRTNGVSTVLVTMTPPVRL